MDQDGKGALGGRARWLLPLIVVAVAASVQVNTLSNGFTWDDSWLIVENPRIDDPSYARYLLFEKKLWRPFKRISFMVDHAIWGPERPWGFHLTNLLLHVGVCLALYFLALRLCRRRGLAAVIALLFAVHPVHVESVANISHRKEPMALLFTLLAFLAWLRARDDRPAGGPLAALARVLAPNRVAVVARVEMLVACGAAYLAGLLSKEVGAVMLPFAIAVYELTLAEGDRRQRLRLLAALGVTLGLVLVPFHVNGYLAGLGERFSADQVEWITESRTDSWLLLQASVLKAFAVSVGMLVWPWPLYLDRAFTVSQTFLAAGPIAGLLCLLAYAGSLVLAWRRSRLAFFGLAWFGLTLLPVSNFIPLTHWLVAERFLYVPSVGFAIVVGALLAGLWDGRAGGLAEPLQRRLAAGLLAALLVGHGAATLAQNRVWENSTTLWSQTLRFNPDSYRALHGLGLELAEDGEAERAEELYRRSIEVNPSYPEPRYGLALLLLNERRYEEAIEHATIHARLDREDPEPFMVIGNSWFHRGDYTAAAEAYREAVDRDPSHDDAAFNLANALHGAQRGEEALVVLDGLVARGASEEALILRGNVLENLGRHAEALRSYDRVVQANPDNDEAWTGMGRSLWRLGEREGALDAWRRSLAIDPDQEKLRDVLERFGG